MSVRGFHDGACLCGAVRIRLHLPVMECYHCHCAQCRLLHGAPFVTWVKAANDRLELLQGEANLHAHDLTREQRLFCDDCGTTVFGQLMDPTMRHVVWVPRAVLPDEAALTPAFHKYYASRASWYESNDDLPRFHENGSLTAS